jgi:ApbE superfamily uncharacterized protein (UPF0280 family)
MTRAHAAMLPDGRRLHLQDGPIDLVIEAFGPADAVQAAYAAAMRRFDGLLDELCSELPLLRAPVRGEGTTLAGPVALRMHAAVVEHAASSFSCSRAQTLALPFSRSREKVPEGRKRARPAEPGGQGGKPPAILPSAVIPGLVPGTHSSSGSQTSHLPGRRMGSRHKAGNDLGEVIDHGEGGVVPDAAAFITPMAAVAGAVADEILAAMLAGVAAGGDSGGPGAGGARSPVHRAPAPLTRAPLTRAYVNNGGDIALFLAPGERFQVGLVDRPDRPSLSATSLFARTELSAEDNIAGIATSGWRGRSFSLGIADAVTVLARTAAAADAAATIVANAVDLPGHPAIVRVPARDLAPDSDLGDRRVTRGVGALSADEIDTALSSGVAVAEGLVRRGLIAGAALHLAGETRVVGIRLTDLLEDAGIAPQLPSGGPAGVAAVASGRVSAGIAEGERLG